MKLELLESCDEVHHLLITLLVGQANMLKVGLELERLVVEVILECMPEHVWVWLPLCHYM